MDQQILWIVAALSVGAIFGTFIRMRGGFGPMNLRAIGIVLIASLVSLLSIGKSENLTAAMGILGAIAGYLFGAKSSKSEEASAFSSVGVNAKGAEISGNAKVAGHDINETVNNIKNMFAEVQKMTNATVEKLQVLNTEAHSPILKRRRMKSISWESSDILFTKRLEALSNLRSNDWTNDWIDLCLEHPDCMGAIEEFVKSNFVSGWKPAEVKFDNTRNGLYVGITFEREIKIPGLLK